MTRRRRQAVLMSVTIASASILILFLATFEKTRALEPPDNAEAMPAWLMAHPTDWLTACVVTEQALAFPLPLPRRIALWQSSYVLAQRLVPLRTNPAAGFVRAGLLNWTELDPAQHRAVLAAAAPLLADPGHFAAMHRPLWELTHDFGYLQRAAPKSTASLYALSELSVAGADFATYRKLRAELAAGRMRDFHAKKRSATIAELIALLPQTITTLDQPLVAAILAEIERRPSDPSLGSNAEALAIFAIQHRVQPLAALSILVESAGKLSSPTRARLAVALRDRAAADRIELSSGLTNSAPWIPYHLERAAFEEQQGQTARASRYRLRASVIEGPVLNAWTNTCGASELCSAAFRTQDGPSRFELKPAQSDEIPPYVEVYVDERLVTEGSVIDRKPVAIEEPGPHRIEVRLINPRTRTGIQRRVRLS